MVSILLKFNEPLLLLVQDQIPKTLLLGYVRLSARLVYHNQLENFECISYSAAEGVDPATVGITHEINSTDPFCPSPMPFLLNTNSSTAVLRGDNFNGTQPEYAGVYTCYSNGLPRDTVEIVVLGNLRLHNSC